MKLIIIANKINLNFIYMTFFKMDYILILHFNVKVANNI